MRSKNSPDGREGPTFIEAARRSQIIDAAIATIAELGYARASLAEIAKRAGISKSIISYHFAGKDDLIEQVVLDVYTRGGERMIPQIMAETTASGRLRAYIRSNIAFLREQQQALLALLEIFTGHRSADGSFPWSRDGGEPMHEHLEGLLREGQEAGEFRDFSPEAMAFAIRATIDMVPGRRVEHPDLDLEALAEELVTIFDLATRKAD